MILQRGFAAEMVAVQMRDDNFFARNAFFDERIDELVKNFLFDSSFVKPRRSRRIRARPTIKQFVCVAGGRVSVLKGKQMINGLNPDVIEFCRRSFAIFREDFTSDRFLVLIFGLR